MAHTHPNLVVNYLQLPAVRSTEYSVLFFEPTEKLGLRAQTLELNPINFPDVELESCQANASE